MASDDALPALAQSIIATRGAQMFPTLTEAEMARLRRFGEERHHAAGEALVQIGEPGHGLIVVLSGEVEVSQHDESGRRMVEESAGLGQHVRHSRGGGSPALLLDWIPA